MDAGTADAGGLHQYPNTAKPDDPDFAPVYGESEPVSVRPTGAIFQPEQVNGIYSDIKAHRVGDIITIQLAESTSASKRPTPRAARTTSWRSTPSPWVACRSRRALRSVGLHRPEQCLQGAGQGGSEQQPAGQHLGQRGQGTAKRQPAGARREVDHAQQWQRIHPYHRSGAPGGRELGKQRLSSQRVANARIYYGGTGDLANTQEQGWLTSFFNGPGGPFKTQESGAFTGPGSGRFC